MEDWLQYKPYNQPTKTDVYYNGIVFGVSNEIKLIEKQIATFGLTQKDFKDLSVFLVSYLEDLVSETNFWNTFIKLHFEFYNKYLPFFKTSNDYKPGNVNQQDISFLIWYFINCKKEGAFVGPSIDMFEYLASKIFPILSLEYDFAPKNEFLKSIYVLDNNPDFYQSRLFIDKIFFFSYLFSHDLRVKLDDATNEVKNIEGADNQFKEQFLKEYRDNMLLTSFSKLLALKGNNWAAEYLGKKHPMYETLNADFKKFTSWFLYKQTTNKYFVLEHIASGKTLNLLKETLNTTLQPNDMVEIGVAFYQNEWWFSGMSKTVYYDKDIINKEQNDIQSLKLGNNIEYDLNEAKDVTLQQCEIFKEFTSGREIVFIERDKFDLFNKNLNNYMNYKISLDRKEKGFPHEPPILAQKYVPFEIKKINVESAVVFFNPNQGLEMGYNLNSAFPDNDNPFYNKLEQTADLKAILYSPDFSTEIIHFMIDKYKNKLEFFGTEMGLVILENLDFVMKFAKRAEYYSKPQLTFNRQQ